MRYPENGDHYLVSFDPGKRVCGVALWDGSTQCLLRAAAVREKKGYPLLMAKAAIDWVGQLDKEVLWVVEQPRRYGRKRSTHDGVEALENVLSYICDMACVVKHYSPYTWKANVPKNIHHERLAHVLTPTELVGCEWWDHNAWDAVGIGLYALGRTESGGRKPR